MLVGMSTHVSEEALRGLLDDESTVVREAVLAELRRRADGGVDFLRRVIREREVDAPHARRFLEELGGRDTIAAFEAFIDSFQYELETGCLLLEQTVHPEVDPVDLVQFLDHAAAKVGEWVRPTGGPFETCKVINRVLFHELGFKGDRSTFDDPENSFLTRVIRRRLGIPISLSSIYLLVARRIGLDLEPVGLPGRFVLASFTGEVFFIDPFERGRFRSEEEIRQMLLTLQIEDAAEYLVPSTVGEILCRFCRNLVHQYGMQRNLERAGLFAGFVKRFEDAYARHADA